MFPQCNSLQGWILGFASTLLLAVPVHAQHCDSCTGLHPEGCAGCQAFLNDCAPSPGASPDMAAIPAPDGSLPQVQPDDFAGAPGAQVPPLQTSPSRPSASDLAGFAGGYGAAQGSQFGVPSMIGDFFAGGYRYSIFNNATASPAGADRRFKFSDNNSPFPQNRVFFNYNHFHNAVTDINGADQDLNRFTFGLERLFGDGRNSWEVRLPFAGTVSADQALGSNDTTSAEFGNIAFALKRLLYRGPCYNLSAGLGIVLPTGEDSEFFSGGTSVVTFDNDAVHLQPFLGVYAPRGRAFHQFFAQLDFDANGNTVLFNGQQSKLQDQTLLFLDYSFGYWLYQNRCHSFIQGLAPMVELHYTTTTQDQDYGDFNGALFAVDPRLDNLNITGGLFMQFSQLASLKIGGVAPLRTDGVDKPFDAEFGLQFTRRY